MYKRRKIAEREIAEREIKEREIAEREITEKRIKGRKIIITAFVVCMIGMNLTGCMGASDAETGEDIPLEELENQTAEDKAGEDIPAEEPEKQAAEDKTGEDIPAEEPGKQSDQDNGDIQQNQESEEDMEPDLYGDISEISDGQFTVNEVIVETKEINGTVVDTMASAAPGYEDMMDTITVVYDENTVFTKKTIWDGGARYEEKKASPADMEKGLTAEMKGSYEEDIFHATEILLVEVVL